MLQVCGSIFQVQSAQKHPEHWGHFWFLHLKEKVDIEKVIHRQLQCLRGQKSCLYHERLEIL